MHTARWDHSVSLRGKRVGVVGTGASAIQVIPAIAPEVERLTVFQRTPIWCLPKLDAPLDARMRALLRWVPGAKLLTRWLSQAFVEATFVLAAHFAGIFPGLRAKGEGAARKLLREVEDPEVRDKLTPRYGLGCKRPSFHNEYVRTFNRDNVHLETAAIEEITPGGVRTADGIEHPIDVLILATGFKVFDTGNMPPFVTRGVGGVALEDWWDRESSAGLRGGQRPGIPELVLDPRPLRLQRPVVLRADRDADAPHRALPEAGPRAEGATRVEITPEANRRYWESMLGRRHNQIFFQGSCANSNSYYFDQHGDAPFRPSLTLEAAWRSARFDLDDYAFAA